MMRAFLAVFEREVIERRLLLAASLLLGLVPLAAPWIPDLAQRGGPELRSAMALILALCFSFGLALILGATVLARDLAESRLGFYFSRPIPGWAVWAGKLSAAAGLALCAGVLILAPAAAVDRRLDLGSWWNDRITGTVGSVLLWLAGVLLLVVLGHATGVVLRSRSPWLLLDFAGLGIISWLAWSAIRRLAVVGAFGAASLATTALLALALVALTASGATQALKGRTDIRRGHRLLSLTLWATLFVASLSAHAYAHWVRAAEPSDLKHIGVAEMAPRGSWVFIHGKARYRSEYTPAFLLDTSSGRFERMLTFLSDFWTTSWFSADGRWAVWLEPQGNVPHVGGPFALVRMDLRHPRAEPERTAMTYSRAPSRLALSADGRRVAVAIGRRLTVEEVPSGKLLASAELPRDLVHYGDFLLFADPRRIRVYGGDLFEGARTGLKSAFQIGEMRLNEGRLTPMASVEEVEGIQVSRDGTRILARRDSDRRFVVLDAGTGAVMAELPSGSRARATFLADGRLALVTGSPSKELRIFSRQLAPERIFRFAGGYLWLAGQPAPDRLIVAEAPRLPGDVQWNRGQVLLLDLATGSMRRLGGGLLPVAHPRIGPESAGSTLFWRGEGEQLVQIDLATGRERVVAGRPAS